MAFISHNVYNKGIENTILNNNDGYVFLALLSAAFSPNDADSGEVVFDKDYVLAFSELRRGSGIITDVSSSELAETEASSTNINKLGKFNKKVLSLFPIAFNRTVSKIENSSAASHFALIKYKGTGKPVVSYSMDSEEVGTDGLPVQKNVYFFGPDPEDFKDASKFEVYLIGELSTTPTINQNSNFMFGGATITFKEAS